MFCLIELNYLPPARAFLLYNHYDKVILESAENYIKGTLRSRTHIAGANGLMRLSVPLCKGKNEQMPIKDVRIFNHERWQRNHWESVRSAYGRAPFFEHYADYLEPYFNKKYDFLWDWNLDLYTQLLKLLHPTQSVILSTGYEKNYTDGTIDLRNKLSKNSIENTDSIPPLKRYPQVFEDRHGFIPDLSVLDLMFCMGSFLE